LELLPRLRAAVPGRGGDRLPALLRQRSDDLLDLFQRCGAQIEPRRARRAARRGESSDSPASMRAAPLAVDCETPACLAATRVLRPLRTSRPARSRRSCMVRCRRVEHGLLVGERNVGDQDSRELQFDCEVATVPTIDDLARLLPGDDWMDGVVA